MGNSDFLSEIERLKSDRLAGLTAAGSESLAHGEAPVRPAGGDQVTLLKVALANEISVSELAAAWMASTPEIDIKIALARQAGDEARHFDLVQGRLKTLGFDMAEFVPPVLNPLFEYLRALPTSVERVAAGLFTLESIAYGVNETFMRLCAARGDHETVRLYREFIQPDERVHQQLGAELLRSHATTPELQARARQAILKTIEIASSLRARAAERLGTTCFPGC